MLSSILPLATAALALLPAVSAHGYIDKMLIDGIEYEGYQPWRDPWTWPEPPPRINREIYSNYPVEDYASIDLQCGGYNNTGSKPAKLHAPATAGEEITLWWTDWPDSHHGPVSTYIARCPGLCSEYSPGRDEVWFKIHEEGQREDWTWAADDFSSILKGADGVKPYKFTIPESLKEGNYIVRHEILALHSAYYYPGAQWYPSCIQISLKSKGTKEGPAEKIAIPGPKYATPDMPGVKWSIYDGTGSPYAKVPYPIPGPKVWQG